MRPPRSRLALVLSLAAGLASPSAWAVADPAAPRDDGGAQAEVSKPAHARPRAKLSYRRASIANLDGTPIWLDGAQLDLYAVSTGFFRIGLEAEGGSGRAAVEGRGATVSFGLLGLQAGLQYPARVTPFLDGRFAVGLLYGQLDSAITVGPGVPVMGTRLATYVYEGGLDAGIELYTVGRLYLSAAIGWVRSTWRGPDLAAIRQDPLGGLREKDMTGDSLTFKIGVGI